MADLRAETDEHYLAGELKMWHDGPQRGSSTAVVVEGRSDELLFRNKLLANSCVFFVGNGWSWVEHIVQFATKHAIPGVIGIVDADFRRVTGKPASSPNLFLTDGHDAEMMILRSPVWDSLLNEFAEVSTPRDGTKSRLQQFEDQKGKTALDALLDTAWFMACLRFLNHKHNLGLIFRKGSGRDARYIDYHPFVNERTLEVNREKLLTEVENFSQKQNFFSRNPSHRRELDDLWTETQNPWEWCNGHDVLHIFSLALEQALANRRSSNKVSPNELERSLRIGYRKEDFQKTILYQMLQEWERNNVPYRLV